MKIAMRMRKTGYAKRLGIAYVLLFFLFVLLFSYVQLQREKEHAKEIYRNQVELVADLVAAYVDDYPADSVQAFVARAEKVDHLVGQVKIRVLDLWGERCYGSTGPHGVLDDYSEEPEVQNARIAGSGSGIRKPFGSDEYHFYFARQYDERFMVWIDTPFRNPGALFTSDNLFAYFLILLFFSLLWVVMSYVGNLKRGMLRICDYLESAEEDPSGQEMDSPDPELERVCRKIVGDYAQLRKSKDESKLLQDKLLSHFHYVQEGICIFSAEREKIYANALFVQHVNNILDEPTFDMAKVFTCPEFREMFEFLDAHTPVRPNDTRQLSYTSVLSKNGRNYNTRLLIFNDNSFEVSLNDITRIEQNKALKHEMTSNIAHELKTPVSSVRGYLETLLANGNIDEENRKFFLERAYDQTLRLTELIQDVSFLNKIEEASDLFVKENLKVKAIVDEVGNDLKLDLEKAGIVLENALAPEVEVYGNRTLLYALFRNLVENTLHYAGKDVSIHIEAYDKDENLYHFDYYDTGCGVPENHLSRLFDRFYRVGEGRTRKDGGSGLGLAIVKNAVQFHGGMISARRYKEHGLEFIFSLQRAQGKP